MPKYTIDYTHFVKVEWGAIKEIEADNIEEAKKMAIEFGKKSEFDDTDEITNSDPISAEGICNIYEGHVGWESIDIDPVAEEIEYDSEA